MQRRHAPRTDDPAHEEEHTVMMISVRGIDAQRTLHEHDAREYNRPGRRRRVSARDKVAAHLTGQHHSLTIEAGASMDDLLDQHDEAHR